MVTARARRDCAWPPCEREAVPRRRRRLAAGSDAELVEPDGRPARHDELAVAMEEAVGDEVGYCVLHEERRITDGSDELVEGQLGRMPCKNEVEDAVLADILGDRLVCRVMVTLIAHRSYPFGAGPRPLARRGGAFRGHVS